MAMDNYTRWRQRKGDSVTAATSLATAGPAAPGYRWEQDTRMSSYAPTYIAALDGSDDRNYYRQVPVRGRNRPDRPDSGDREPGDRSPFRTNEDRRQQQAYDRAQAHLNGETGRGNPPDLFPNGVRPGGALEGVAQFGNRTADFSGFYSGQMQRRGAADRYQTGRSLEQAARWLPQPPDMLSADDMIDMANEMNQRINFRNNRA